MYLYALHEFTVMRLQSQSLEYTRPDGTRRQTLETEVEGSEPVVINGTLCTLWDTR